MKLKYISIVCIFIILAIIYYNYNPEMYNFFPQCPFHKYLGLDCPGCGSQRAIHALLHGNILLAINYNLLLVISLPFLLVHFFIKFYALLVNKSLTWNIWHKSITPKIILIFVIVFWIIRNLPYQPFYYLAA